MPIRMAQYGLWLLPTNSLSVFDHFVALVLRDRFHLFNFTRSV